jgi:hypothetical protein
MKIIKDIKIKVKKAYFTTSAAIVLFIIIAGCVSMQAQPISVVSLRNVAPVNPAGLVYMLTVNASSTNVPITHLSARFMVTKDFVAGTTFQAPVTFNFPDINQSNPLMPGQTASDTSGLIVEPFRLLETNGTTPVLIQGTLQNGQSFSYWTNGTFVWTRPNYSQDQQEKNVIKRGTFIFKMGNASSVQEHRNAIHNLSLYLEKLLNLTSDEAVSIGCNGDNCTYEVIKINKK